jgi:hypothetical protein
MSVLPEKLHLTQLRWMRQNRKWCATASLNTTSRMHFKKWQKLWEWCIFVEGDNSVATRISFYSLQWS